MNTIQQITNALTPLASKLETGAAQLYRIYTRQQVIVGITQLVWAVFCGILLIISIKLGLRWGAEATKITSEHGRRYNNDEEIKYGVAAVMCVLVAIAASIATPILLTQGLQHILNPQYYTINELLCTVKNCN